SSDRSPKEIPDIEERLRSRFEWGLIAGIQPPDFETRVAILKKKAELDRLPLPDDVAFFIANRVKSNLRQLHGCLILTRAFPTVLHAVNKIEALLQEDPKFQKTLEHIINTIRVE